MIIVTIAGGQISAAAYYFEKKLERYTASRTPGAAILVIQHKKTLFKKGYGYADIKKQRKIDIHTTFDLASTSKNFSGMAIAMLQEQGKLDIEDGLGKYFPELGSYVSEVKIRHLLNHTSGLPEYTAGLPSGLCGSDLKDKTLSTKDLIAFLRTKQSLEFRPGTKHEFSNTGFVLLSLIIEKVGHVPFEQFMGNQFRKLRMNDTFVMAPAAVHNLIARPYSGWPFFEELEFSSCRFLTGDGGIYSSIDDLGKWVLAIEENKLISAGLKA